jgi:hypothetical protein
LSALLLLLVASNQSP